ncbi:MAG TPA: GNAT family N-acetyltransferase [Alphaproteobacteria bacterium]|jgi:RimJ/RimL family protein N-acetyltransferase
MPTYSRFETRRLILRRPAPADEPDLIALDAQPDVKAYLAFRGADPERLAERIRPRIELSQADPDAPYGWWVLEDNETGAFHGRALLAPLWEGSEDAELGLYLMPGSRKKGYATEAATALLDHAFMSLKLPRVVGATARENKAVTRMLQRLNFSHKGKIMLYFQEADRYLLTAEGWLPRRR